MTPIELKEYLKTAGISQMELARQLEVDGRTVRRYCDGRAYKDIPKAIEFAAKFVCGDLSKRVIDANARVVTREQWLAAFDYGMPKV